MADFCCVSLVLHYLNDILCKNYNYVFVFAKVIHKTLSVPFFSGHGVYATCTKTQSVKSFVGCFFQCHIEQWTVQMKLNCENVTASDYNQFEAKIQELREQMFLNTSSGSLRTTLKRMLYVRQVFLLLLPITL